MDENIFREIVYKVDASKFYLAVYSENFIKDPVCLIQFSHALIIEKPIFFIVVGKIKLPKALKEIATHVNYVENDDIESIRIAAEEIGKIIVDRQNFI